MSEKLTTINNLFMLEPYMQGQGIRSEIRAGLALPGQKLNLVPLKLLADAILGDRVFKKGSLAMIAEDTLMTQQFAKQVRKAPGVEGEFILVDARFISAIGEI